MDRHSDTHSWSSVQMSLEPTALLRHFSTYPPFGFEPFLTSEGVPGFFASFDLLTTADDELRQAFSKIPGHKLLRHLLKPRTCFFGSTVSEYCPIPGYVDAESLPAAMLSAWGGRSMLAVIKDIPVQSPLLSAAANQRAANFLAACEQEGFVLVDGQALAFVKIDFSSEDEYLSRLSSGRRRDIRRKLRSKADLQIQTLPTGCERLRDRRFLEELYGQYLEVYAQSDIHFDLLPPEFFAAILQDASLNGRLFLYYAEESLIGFNLCFIYDGMLIDKYVGFRYATARAFNLYFVSWMENLKYACSHGLHHYVAGWTDPQIKAYLGAQFTFTRHAVFVRNPVLRYLMRKFSSRFESDKRWFEANAHGTAARPGL